MSEPARSYPPLEDGGRPVPGPLRDWLAAMKAHAPADVRTAEIRPAEARGEAPRFEARPEPRGTRPSEPAWSPRLVAPAAQPPAPAEDADVSELMAENMMLKAKLRLEVERQEELQAMLADEIRELRRHIRDEIGSMEDLRAAQEEVRLDREEFRGERERYRAEREETRAERDRAVTDCDALRAERQALAAERDALREERDLWRARTEALVQPLFQAKR